jgi:hypothetical protein
LRIFEALQEYGVFLYRSFLCLRVLLSHALPIALRGVERFSCLFQAVELLLGAVDDIPAWNKVK